MENYYRLLGIDYNASSQDIKRAFREQAKRLHPDIAGNGAEGAMRKLLAAYKVLSNQERRYEYDRVYGGLKNKGFDYQNFLREQPDDPGSQAKLVFFELMRRQSDRALSVWRTQGGLGFPMDKYLDRQDWMDCTFILAEELEKRRCYYEAFTLLVVLIRAERQKPYFKHFTRDIEGALKDLVRLRLKPSVDKKTYVHCIKSLLGLGFPPKDEARWMRSMAEALFQLGETGPAQGILQEALKRDPRLACAVQLRRKLNL
ncbi:MAG: DnaJ domain-containing protein [Spirochaetaceae bacterium]|jgi:curved DNA-binding protein CbpA|nr:DnaJ domain-containing protein [Spirochaetaceae bacterium]